MSDSVLGNDPFKTAAHPAKAPKKSAKKKAGSAKGGAKKNQASESKTSAKDKKTKADSGKIVAQKKPTPAKKKTAPKKAAVAKKTGESKKASAPLKPPVPAAGKAPAPVPAPVHAPVSKTRPLGVEAAPSAYTRAIGGGDPRVLPMLRPESFSLGQEYGCDPEFRKRLSPLLNFLYRFYWRVEVKGIENLPKDGRAVLVGNHAGILPFDGLMLSAAIRSQAGREAWPLIEDFFYYAPVLGDMLSKVGCVRACQENAQRLLAEQQLVIAFPEGIKGIVKPYRRRYRLQRFGRGGFVKLCLNADAPAIPVAIVGSEETHPVVMNLNNVAKFLGLPYLPLTPLFPLLGPLGLIPLPAKWTIVIGEPMYINQFGPESAGDRVAVNRLSNRVKSQIQKLIDMEISLRQSRWR